MRNTVVEQGRGEGLVFTVGGLDFELMLKHDHVALSGSVGALLLESGAERVKGVTSDLRSLLGGSATDSDGGLRGEEVEPSETTDDGLFLLCRLERDLGLDSGNKVGFGSGGGTDHLGGDLGPGSVGVVGKEVLGLLVEKAELDESKDELGEALVSESATDDSLGLGDVVPLLEGGRVTVGVSDKGESRVDVEALSSSHELVTGDGELLAILPELGSVAERKEDTTRRPGELVAERVVSSLGSGQTTTVGEEGLDLAALSVNIIDGLDGVEVVETRVKTDLVHDGDTSLLDLGFKGTDSVRNVRGCDDVDLVFASGLDDGSVVDVRNERDNNVVALDDVGKSSSIVDIDGSGSRVVETMDEMLRVLELGGSDCQAVFGEASGVLSEGLGDVTGTKEENLLRSTLSLGVALTGGDDTSRSRGAVLDDLAGELGDSEGSLVDLRVVVSAVGNLTKGLSDVSVGVKRADNEADLARWISGDGSEGVVGNGEELLGGSSELANEVEVNPDTLGLGGDVSSGLEGLLEEGKVGLLEESLGGTNGVRRVGDDDVEAGFVLGVLEELETVTNDDSGLGMSETLGHLGKVLLGDTGDGLINVAEDGLLDRVVLDNLTEYTTVTTADNKDTLGVGVGSDGKVSDHLLVGELVALCALDDTIENENVAEGGGLEDEDILVEGPLVVKDTLNLQAHGLTRPLRVGLVKPTIADVGVSDDAHFFALELWKREA